LSRVQICHDGKGLASDWKLAKIELTSVSPKTMENIGAMQTFKFDKIIKANKVYDCGAE